MPRTIDIIVPVYNEEACVDEFIKRVTAVGLREALMFVDNASTDLTVQRIESHEGVRLVRHDRNAGTGRRFVMGSRGPVRRRS